jgi:1-hydroxycarotenoid 3,4-desaturase
MQARQPDSSAAGTRAPPPRRPVAAPRPFVAAGSKAPAGGDRVLVIGAGVAGLSAALTLAAHGVPVELLESADRAGGKLHAVPVGGWAIDAGPTVLTLREVFDELFAEAGARFDEHLRLERAGLLARHAWSDGEGAFDLHADAERSAQEVARRFGARAAAGFRRFAADAARTFAVLDASFMRASRPNPLSLAYRVGWRGLPDLLRIRAFATLWDALGDYFDDARLRQLFGRYATYCGSSPFTAPATLMLVAHAEQRGVWLVEGGLAALGDALLRLARARGVQLRLACPVDAIELRDARACGVRLRSGERLAAAAVIHCGDDAALPALLGRPAKPRPFAERSLSALTWQLVGRAEGLPLAHHNVLFSDDYRQEFDDILLRRVPPRAPTVYLCAPGRLAATRPHSPPDTAAGEPMFMIVNAPADEAALGAEELTLCEIRMLDRLAACGLKLRFDPQLRRLTTPQDFARRYPGSSGAIYGAINRGWLSAFTRPAAAVAGIRGLYRAGGSCHPGPGLPMVTLSGRLAAQALLANWASRARSRPAATPGGMSTPSAPTRASD